MSTKVLTHNLAEPLNGAQSANVEIDCGPGHLVVNRLDRSESVMARGTLQYLEKQGAPDQNSLINDGRAALTLKAGNVKFTGFHFPPWAACGGAYEWQIQLNPAVALDMTVKSHGGNVKLNLGEMTLNRLMAESGGGNLNVVLPENAANLVSSARTGGGNVNVEVGAGLQGENTITAESGAGNVNIRLPEGVAAKIDARTGMGKVIVDPRFTRTDKFTYQSADYDTAATKIEVTARSGAGTVSIDTGR